MIQERNWSHKKIARTALGMYVLLFLFFAFTNPRSLSVPLLIAPVVWLFVSLSLTFYLVFSKIFRNRNFGNKKVALYAIVTATCICLILLLKSINQLSSRDIILVVIFISVASIYFPKIKFQKKT